MKLDGPEALSRGQQDKQEMFWMEQQDLLLSYQEARGESVIFIFLGEIFTTLPPALLPSAVEEITSALDS